MMSSFLICPVRNATPEQLAVIENHNKLLNIAGEEVYWPHEHTKQDGDPIGIRICRDNREAMFTRERVRVRYDPTSRGSCFDIGMASIFELAHPGCVHIANPEEFLASPSSPQLSLLVSLLERSDDQRLQLEMAQRCWEDYPVDELLEHTTLVCRTHTLHSPTENTGALCVYGQIFAQMRSTPLQIKLGFTVEQTPNKSFNNVLLWLAEYTKYGPRTV
ncbi:MAG: hypothetical protein A3D65_06500 [Candidatus Lloydbacteria bacterium RIFCSPHIGHO2_02_FULL_50_13]|uniref:Uncharacterized protein n=1 Tax=Candidatus Lloydbacteria bacterium RIFCSPHIGHO2_02_FULL_50_13 TaxID=1798661 RepID=A0A1G2D7C9_9BACT|nr:MAG: hypothetical protein A3D65_06500 [Candidatus Lloydbacteria bacterium RIFCSPHIGHO2_02_FULL_50_13]